MIVMGYYSETAISHVPYTQKCSVIPAQKQLLWRLEELQDQLELLSQKRRHTEDRFYCSDEELRWILPGSLFRVADVKAAMELVIDELWNRYGIWIPEEEYSLCVPLADEITGMQISFAEFLSAAPCPAA